MGLAVSEDTAFIFIEKILIALYWIITQLHVGLTHHSSSLSISYKH